MLRPEVEYWTTPAAYVRSVEQKRRLTLFERLAERLAAARADRLARRKRVAMLPKPMPIPDHIRSDLGLPPVFRPSWHWDPIRGTLPDNLPYRDR